MSSIQQVSQPSDTVAAVVQMLRSPLTQGKVLIVIEGEDDSKLYRKIFREDTTHQHVLGGCLHMEDVARDCSPSYGQRLIVLKDADFDHLNGTTYPYSNLFLTDTHDAETMIVNRDCIEAICCEHLSKSDDTFMEKVLQDLLPLSYMKWYDNVHRLNTCFDILKVSSVYDGANPIDIGGTLTKLYANPKNNTVTRMTTADVESFIRSNPNADVLQLTNGHDLCECIRIRLHHLMATPVNINHKEIPKLLRTHYSKEQYRNTSMYNQINQWEVLNGHRLFK